ncbi:MAG: hypothetical protein CM15mP39_07250 [Synechococcus sp.]|nr:MAG: hypothetical protein CM15mP39_07250 [Synechococcus sp.]
MTTPLDIPAILLILATIFGAINYKFVKLPHTIGLMIVALVASLSLIALDLTFPALGMSILVNEFLGNIDFNVTLMQGMLSFLLFAGALHVDLDQLLENKWTILHLDRGSCLYLKFGGGFWIISGAVGLSFLFLVVYVEFGFSEGPRAVRVQKLLGPLPSKSKDCWWGLF